MPQYVDTSAIVRYLSRQRDGKEFKMNQAETAVHRDFPIGSLWIAPHPVENKYHEVEVINHTVGAGLRRREGAGIIVAGKTGGPYEIGAGYVMFLDPAPGNELPGWG